MLSSYREVHISAGDLNTRVVIERPVEARHPTLASVVQTWEQVAKVWARVEESARPGVAASESGVVSYARPTVVTIRTRPGLSTTMRVKLADGRLLEIVGMGRLGGSGFTELACTEWSVQQP